MKTKSTALTCRELQLQPSFLQIGCSKSFSEQIKTGQAPTIHFERGLGINIAAEKEII